MVEYEDLEKITCKLGKCVGGCPGIYKAVNKVTKKEIYLVVGKKVNLRGDLANIVDKEEAIVAVPRYLIDQLT